VRHFYPYHYGLFENYVYILSLKKKQFKGERRVLKTQDSMKLYGFLKKQCSMFHLLLSFKVSDVRSKKPPNVTQLFYLTLFNLQGAFKRSLCLHYAYYLIAYTGIKKTT
jgi:hypothetical protein